MSNINKITMMDPEELVIVGLDTDHDETHELYDERIFLDVDPAFVDNIVMLGVTETVTVREADGKVFVVTGRQRVKAAREANKRFASLGVSDRVKVPVGTHAMQGANKGVVMTRIIAENTFRKEDDILTKVRKAARLYNYNQSTEETSVACGVSTATINNWLKLHAADDSVHQAIQQDKIGLAAAYYLCTHFSSSQQREVLNTLLKRAGDIRISEELVKNYHREIIGMRTLDKDSGLLNDEEDDKDWVEDEDDEGGGFVDGVEGDEPMTGDGDDPIKTSADKMRAHKGITRTWMRQALASDAGQRLDAEQRGVIYWLAYGSNENSKITGWWNHFHVAVNKEKEEKKKKKKAKKKDAEDSPV